MKSTNLLALALAGGMLTFFATEASAVVCARGVYRAGCVGPNGAVVYRRAPVYGAVVVRPAPIYRGAVVYGRRGYYGRTVYRRGPAGRSVVVRRRW